MELLTVGSLRAEQVVWRPAHGGVVLTVVCKATFALRPGVSPLAPAGQGVATGDVYTEDGRALVVASEVVPLKKQPEVILTGHAYAPGGKRATSFVARLVVGEIDKAVRVDGDRSFGPDGEPGEPAPFVRMPLTWERAAGGPETDNPVGRAIGSSAQADAYGRVQAPNLWPPGAPVRSRWDMVSPVGFGPIAPLWPSRARCLHRHAAGWDPGRWHERALPGDIDLAYFNAAPANQRRTAPFGEEAMSLENLHPLFGQLSTRLAKVTPSVTVERGHGSEAVQLRCDTLVIDSDKGLAMLVWRGHLVLDHPDRPGRIVVSYAEVGEGTGPARAVSAPVFDRTQAAEFAEQASTTLPFSGVTGSEAGGGAGTPIGVVGGGGAPAEKDNPLLSGATVAVDALFGSTMAFGFANPAPAVPFPVSGESGPPREPPSGDGGAGLPFLPATSARSPSVPPAPIALLALSSPEISPSELSSPEVTSGLSVPFAGSPPSDVPLALPLSPATDLPVPPPMLGADVDSAGAPAEPAPPGPLDDVDAYPPARCGGIAARVECNESTIADILRAEDLDAERWERVHDHWQDRIDAEAARGRTKLRAEYDGAYVAALESERLPITVEVYARIAEAAERGALDEELAELRFPEDAWLHIQRAWIPRMITDPKLGKQVRAAIAVRRAAMV